MATLSLMCRCGDITGTASDVTPSSGNRVVCCCADCQAFADWLGPDIGALDEFGGTEIVQMAQSRLTIDRGQDKLRSMRLSDKGLLRWYAGCCHTPIGNTMSARMPFVGVIHTFMDAPDRNAVLGPIRAVVQTRHARGVPGYPTHSAGFPPGITARIAMKLLLWKLQGRHTPSAFFGDDGRPVVEPVIAPGGGPEHVC